MRTVAMAQNYIRDVNSRMFVRGNITTYYSIGFRNDYKALDVRKRCDECMKKAIEGVEVVCNRDGLIENFGCYNTGELVEVTKAINKHSRDFAC